MGDKKQVNKTIVTFKAIRKGKIIYKNIPIYHHFQELSSEEFSGIQLPATSVESQVIHYLDEIDKRDIMIKYDFDIIIDYFIKKKRVKKNEIEEFVKFCKPYLDLYPQLTRPFEAVVSESQELLFGKRKSNEQKFKEVLGLIKVSFKAAEGAIDLINKIWKGINNELKELNI
jgi:hypothetical protein